MFQDILEESWVYQEIGQGFLEKGFEQGIERGLERGLEQGLKKGLEQGREEGRLQEQRQTLMSYLQVRFPETLALAHQQTNAISDPEILRNLINRLFIVRTVEEVRQILLDVNKQ